MITATLFLLTLCLVRAGIVHRRLKHVPLLAEVQAEAQTARYGHLIGAATCLIILVWGFFFSLMGFP